MKLIQKEISKEGGRVSLVPEDAEDLWTVYNLIVSAAFPKCAFLVGVAFWGRFPLAQITFCGRVRMRGAMCPMCSTATPATGNTRRKAAGNGRACARLALMSL
jgi:hypothetical protein